MGDTEGAGVTGTGPLAARLAQIRERNEAHIKAMAFTEWTVQREPCGNVRLLLGVVEAVLALAGELEERAAGLGKRPDRAQAYRDNAAALRAAISAALPGESRPRLRGTWE